MNTTFIELGLAPNLAAGLAKAAITVPTPVQQQVIPAALAGRDIVAQSPTGTGKTLAYLLPLLQRIDGAKRELQGLILAPTHELAIQIQRQIEKVTADAAMPILSTPIIGNANISRQIDKLKARPQIIVGSSGRILELTQKRKINPQTVTMLVLDEADRLLDEHNLPGTLAVLKTVRRERQVLLFSATITPEARERAARFLREPEFVAVAGQGPVAPLVEHLYVVADQRDKLETLRKLMHALAAQQALVFINRPYDIEQLVAKLEHHGWKAAGLHGSSGKLDRKKTLEDFRKGKIQLLVASDLAARGLDVPGIRYVINLDLPEDPQLYLHRVGRTGRAGEAGTAVSILTPHESGAVEKVERMLKIKVAAKELTHGRLSNPFVKPRTRPPVIAAGKGQRPTRGNVPAKPPGGKKNSPTAKTNPTQQPRERGKK